jgi:hypothetical protein
MRRYWEGRGSWTRSDGRWSAPRNLSPVASLSSHQPRVAIDGGGFARVVWATTERHVGAIVEASRPAGRSWSAAASIVREPSAPSEPSIVAADDGEAAAVWRGSEIGSALHPAPPGSP